MFEKKKSVDMDYHCWKKIKKKNADLFQSKLTDFKIYFKSFFSLLNILVMYLYLKLYQI